MKQNAVNKPMGATDGFSVWAGEGTKTILCANDRKTENTQALDCLQNLRPCSPYTNLDFRNSLSPAIISLGNMGLPGFPVLNAYFKQERNP